MVQDTGMKFRYTFACILEGSEETMCSAAGSGDHRMSL